MTSILSLAGVSKRFHAGTPSEVSALRKLHFTVEAGDFVTIIGSNGAGKSTLLQVIAGMVIPDTGTVTFEGPPLSVALLKILATAPVPP